MSAPAATADVNIHLRARPQDRELIDRAAEVVGTNRSQFMLLAALSEARNVLLDQTIVRVDPETHAQFVAALDAAPDSEGYRRLMNARPPWSA